MEKEEWESIKMTNHYNEDDVKSYRLGNQYYFMHIPTGKVTKTYTLIKTVKDMEEDLDYYQLELELFSGRMHLFLQDVLGI